MSSFKKLNNKQANDVLCDMTAALALCQNSIEAADFLSARLRVDTRFLPLSLSKKIDFEDGFIRSGLLGLAYSGYVVAWERYRKLVNIDPANFTEASIIFDLDKYSDAKGDALQRDYPSAYIVKWVPTGPPIPSYWFASVLRNSIAHGQTHLMHSRPVLDEDFIDSTNPDFTTYEAYCEIGSGTITLYNMTNQGLKNFEVQMLYRDFYNLIVAALNSFMAKVIDPDDMFLIRNLLKYTPFLDRTRKFPLARLD